MTLTFLMLAAVVVATDTVNAQTSAPEDTTNVYARKTLRAVRLTGQAPTIDAHFDDAVWQTAPAGTDFVQLQPDPGKPSTQKTEIRFAYDDDAVYVAARMHDTRPDSVVAQLARRDSEVYSEWTYVCLDSYYDRRTAFCFGVNPKGVKVDVLLYDDTNDDESWDAVWDVAARQDSLGWVAEYRIPLSQLRFSLKQASDGSAMTWGMNVLRKLARRNEESFWSPLRRDANAFVSAFGNLTGMAGLEAPRRMEVTPYSMSRVVRAPGAAANPFHQANATTAGAGADMKLGVTSDLTVTATVNPDFGQVEADPSEVNLTAFETFLREKRPFSVEGFDIFRAGIGVGDGDSGNEGLFYSRRIGRASRGDVPDDAEYADMPENATIIGAAKLSGKTRSGWSVGVLSATTAEENADYVTETGTRGEVAVEPLTHYGVARVIKDLDNGQSAIGAVFTATNRKLTDELSFLRTNAYAGGINGRKRWRNGDFQLSAFLFGSRVEGDTAAINRTQRSSARYFQRPDNDHTDYDATRTSLKGAAGGVEFFKVGGGNWRYAVALNVKSPTFEVNDLGYMPAADQILQVAYVGYNMYKPTRHFNRWNINVNQWSGQTFGGERNTLGGNFNANGSLKNTAEFWFGASREQSVYSESALRGGPLLRRPGYTRVWAGYDSDERKAFNWWVDMNYQFEDETDGNRLGVYPGVRIRASDRAELRINPGISVNRSAWQYVSTEEIGGADRFLFGRLEQVTTSLTARLNYTFTPNLSLQLYAEPFISAGDFSAFKEVADPRAQRFADRFHTYTSAQIAYDGASNEYAIDRDANGTSEITIDNPDFNYRALRSNVVLR